MTSPPDNSAPLVVLRIRPKRTVSFQGFTLLTKKLTGLRRVPLMVSSFF